MAKRFQTYFGIPVPPFKRERLGAGTTTIRFVLPGKIISKKNNQQAFGDRTKAKEYLNDLFKWKKPIGYEQAMKAVNMVTGRIRGNDEWDEMIKTFVPIIETQKDFWIKQLSKKGLVFPIPPATFNLRFYFKGRHIIDTVNKQQTIQDLLIKANVISDDDYKTLNPIRAASACYFEELIHDIAFVSLSFRL